MKLSDDIKVKIQAEYDTWQAGQYAGKSKEERQALEVFVELWKKNRETALEYAVQDPDMAKFLDTHLSEKTFANFMM